MPNANVWDYPWKMEALGENPEVILRKYAALLHESDSDFTADVTEVRRDTENAVYYSFYIVVPKLRDYIYKLFEVKVPSLVMYYPLELTHFAKEPRDIKTRICRDAEEFEKMLTELIQSPQTFLILRDMKILMMYPNGKESSE